MSTFDAVRNRKRGEDAQRRVLERTYSPIGVEDEQESLFSAVRNRSLSQPTQNQTENSASTSGSNSKSPTDQIGVIFGDPRQSELLRAIRNEPMAAQQYKQNTGIDVQNPKNNESKLQNVLDNITAFTDKAVNATTFGATDLIDRFYERFGPNAYSDELKENRERSENLGAAGAAADVLGSLVSGQAAYKAAGAAVDPLIKTLPKLTQSLIRGTAAGAAFELPRQANQEAAEYLGGQQQSVPQRLKNVGLSAALGGLTDLGIGAGGLAAAGIKNPLLGKAVGGGIGVGSLGAALGTANELQEKASGQQQSLGGRLADIGKYTLAGAGLGIAGGTVAAKFMRNKGVPEETITEVLALPEGRGTIRQSAAAERASVAAGTDPIINPSDFTPEPLGLPQGNTVGPTVARRGTKTNIYRQKFEDLIREAQKREFSPGREDIELENLWSQMAERNDPGLDELVDLAYPKRTNVPQRGMVGAARSNQEMREVAGVGNPVRSSADRNPSQVISPAAAPQTVAGRAGGTPRAEILDTPDVPLSSAPRQPVQENITSQSISREQDIMNRINNLTQEDIEYIQSGQFDQTKLPPEVSSISRQEPAVREQTPLVDATPDVTAQPQSQDMFTDLFGEQNLGISANRSRTPGQGPVTTEDQIVRRSIRNDKEGVAEALKAQVRAAYQDHVDALDPLKKLGQNVYDTAMDANRANNIANNIVNKEFVNLQGQVVGESLKDIFTKVARGQDKKFLDFLNLRRATTRMDRNEQVFDSRLKMTPEKVQERLDTLESRHPGFEAISNDYYEFWNNVRQMGVDEGLISADMKAALETAEPYYVPQMRQFLRSEKPGRDFLAKSSKQSLSGQKAPIQKLSEGGSGRSLVDARKSTIEAVGAWTNAALRNRALQPVVKALKADPNAFKGIVSVVDNTANVSQKSIKDINAIIQKDGIEGLIAEFDNNFEMVMNKGKDINLNEDNILRVMVDGEPAYLRIEDPEVVKAAISMGPQATSMLIDMMGAASNLTKRGATGLFAPLFAIKSATMDLTQSAIQAKNPVKQAVYSVYSIFSGIGDTFGIKGLKDWAQEYRRMGGGYSYSLKGDRAVNKSIDNITRYPFLSAKNAVKVGKNVAASPFKLLESVGNVLENAPRIAASRIELENLGREITPENVRKAMNAGREATVNYSRKGLKSREIESFVPYSNPAIQGTYRILRALKNNPVRTLSAIGVFAVLPKFYEYTQFHDDPDYQNIPARERMRNVIWKKNQDGSFVKTPMDPAYNSFGEMTIELLRHFKDNDPQAFNGSMDALANAWTPPLVTGMLQGVTKKSGPFGSLAGLANSTVFGPASALLSNKSFTGAPIVPRSMSDRSPKYQYDEKTSAVAKKIGKITGLAPMYADYIMRAYGGDLARIVLPLTSDVGKGNTRNTLLKNFIVDPTFSNNLTEDFFNAKDKLNQAYADYNEAGAALPVWYDDELRKEMNSTAKGSISKDLSELRDWKKEVTADKTLSNRERTEKLREIQQQINEIYISINSVLQERGIN